MTTLPQPRVNDRGVFRAVVAANDRLCDEHYRVRLTCDGFPEAQPGQFVQLLCDRVAPNALVTHVWSPDEWPALTDEATNGPLAFLRRAFSIAELERNKDGATISVIHRVVGVGTRWLEQLEVGDAVSVLGPLGNRFPIEARHRRAYLVCGGVGFPPMIWLARALHNAGKQSVCFFGARSSRLIPLTLSPSAVIARDATRGCAEVAEFAPAKTPVVLSTDDGSVGLKGFVTDALARYAEANPVAPDELVVYACGPEIMMHTTAKWCERNGILCHVCMERAMACGMGTCQSCVVRCHDPNRETGWRYRLCCSDGPVFDSRDVIWERPE